MEGFEAPLPRRIVVGSPAGSATASLLTPLGVKKVLLVTDEVLAKLDTVRAVIEDLRREGLEVHVFSGVPPEPGVEVGRAVAYRAREVGAEAIIALGGGSAIDAAKAGWVESRKPGTPLESISPLQPLGIEAGLPILVAIPTTSGTGSDASFGIVLYKEGVGKIAVGSPEVTPFYTVLDPKLPASAPEKLRAATGMDALSHALESLVAQQSNPFSEALAEKAATILFTRLPDAVSGDLEAIAEVHLAATMAGMAFSSSGLGLAHAIAHPLGAALRLHHGTTVGILLPEVVRHYSTASPEAKSRYERLRKVLEDLYGLEPAEDLATHVERLQSDIGFPRKFSEAGVSRVSFEAAVEKAVEGYLHDPDIAFSPTLPEPAEVREMLYRLF